jgi:tetratricopeptide (TPR) repeat protein
MGDIAMKRAHQLGLLLAVIVLGVFWALIKEQDRRWSLHDAAASRAFEDGRLDDAEKHVRKALGVARTYRGHDRRLARSLTGMGWVSIARARHGQAVGLFKEAMAIYEASKGSTSLDVANCLSGMATAYGKQARDTEAEALLNRAIEIREAVLGPNHPDVAGNLVDLAWLQSNEGRYPKAERLARRALGLLGPNEHTDVSAPERVRVSGALAMFLIRQDKYDEAWRLLERARAALERGGRSKRVELARVLNRLGIIASARGRYEEAKRLYQQALKIRADDLGPEHPDVAACQANVATVLVRQKRYQEARPLYTRSIATLEKALGPDQPGLAWTLGSLARLDAEEGRTSEAGTLLKRALKIRERTWRPTHPEMALSLIQLAGLHLRQGRLDESEPLCRRALAILDSPEVGQPGALSRCWETLARIEAQRRHDAAAESHFRKALQIRAEHGLGDDPDTAEFEDHFAELLERIGRSSEAALLKEQAEAIRAKVG